MLHLREIRKSKGMTMKQLGEAVGVTESAIGMYEKGRRTLSYEMLLKISEVLGCSVVDLINNFEDTEFEKKEKPVPDDRNELCESDIRLINWFRSLPKEKQKAILISQDAPEDLL